MKKVQYHIAILLSAFLLLNACNDLDLTPEDYYGSGNFWKTAAQADGFMIGIHKQFRDKYQIFWLLGEARGGLQMYGSNTLGQSIDYSEIKAQNLSANNTGLTNWAGLYAEILNLNLAIKELQQATYLQETDKNYYLGQAHGLRAWYYFWLYRTYGGVPINNQTKVIDKTPTGGEELYTPRSTPKKVMDFIKSDLEKSENYFGNNNTISKSLWSKYATLMLKAEVYLWSAKVTNEDQIPDVTNDLTKAENALLEIKNSGIFSLQTDFSRVFAYDNKENSEIIFTMPFMENEKTNWFNMFVYTPSLFTEKYNAQGQPYGTDPLNMNSAGNNMRHEYKFSLFQKYDSSDTRRNATFFDFYSDTSQGNPAVVIKKYLGFVNSSGNRILSDDIPIYRYAEVLLMLAEVANKKGEDPSPYINQIRARAYGNNNHNYTNAGFFANELAILEERDKEFVGENKRWFDVLRMQDANGKPLVFSPQANYGENLPILNQATESYKIQWPVNVDVMNNDPEVKQTPGY